VKQIIFGINAIELSRDYYPIDYFSVATSGLHSFLVNCTMKVGWCASLTYKHQGKAF